MTEAEFLAQYMLPDDERKRLLIGNALLGLGSGLMQSKRGGELTNAGLGLFAGVQQGQGAVNDAQRGQVEKLKLRQGFAEMQRKQQYADGLTGTMPEQQGPPSSLAPNAPPQVAPMTSPQNRTRAYLISIGVPEEAIAAAAQSVDPPAAVGKLIEHYTKPEFGQGKIPLMRTPDGFKAVVPQGYTEALTAQTSAETGAQEAAKAQYDLVQVPQSDGSTRMMTRAQAAQYFSGGNAPRVGVSGVGPALGVTANPQQVKDADAARAVQTSQETKIAGGQADDYMAALKSERDAPGNIGKLQLLKQHLSNVETGKAAPLVQNLKAYASYIAPDLAKEWTKDVPYAQAAAALSNEMALQLRSPSNGAGMPGAMSDADRNFLVSMTSNISNDPRAIPKMIDARIALEKRSQEIGIIARDYRKEHGKIDDGFYAAIADYANRHPLFAGQEAQAAPAAPPTDRAAIEAEMRRRKLIP